MRTPSSISFRYGSHGLGEATLSHLLKPRMDPTHNPSYEDHEYVHDNSFFTNTSSRNRGFFIIAPDWVSERKGIMSTHYQWPADSWSLGMLSELLIVLTVFLLFCTMATKLIQVHAVCFNVWPENERCKYSTWCDQPFEKTQLYWTNRLSSNHYFLVFASR